MGPAAGARLSAVQPTVDLTKLSAPARKLLDPASAGPMQQMAARGVAPGVRPGEAITVVALLSESTDAALAAYEGAVLNALEDTEGTLITYGRSQTRREALRVAAAARPSPARTPTCPRRSCPSSRCCRSSDPLRSTPTRARR